MAYVEAVLIRGSELYEFSVEVDDMEIMMKDILEIIVKFIAKAGYPFMVTSFHSNVLNKENFNIFINNYINKQNILRK